MLIHNKILYMAENKAKTKQHVLNQYKAYPNLQIEDIFKYIYQSAYGCEHFVLSEDLALDYIRREYAVSSKNAPPLTEKLDGEYTRVYLSCINSGLSEKTLARLFCLSAKKEPLGRELLEKKLIATKELIASGNLPFDSREFEELLSKWQSEDYPALHHSSAFREAYHPSYRVIANEYADFIELFSKIDAKLADGSLTLVIEGGSASGKTTLSDILSRVYDCNIFHMDDFFLRPEQRTDKRLREVGGNIDRERFLEEVLTPLKDNKPVLYRRYDCSTQTLGHPITVAPKPLTVIEGVYSMHLEFGKYYGLSLFLDINPENQRQRILKRNPTQLAKRFFEEWIPLENAYFSQMKIKNRADILQMIKE